MSSLYMIEGVCENVRLGFHIHMKGWGLVGELVSGVQFVGIGGVISGWFMVCKGDKVEDRLVGAHDEANGQWELQGLMRHEKLGVMGRLVPMR